mmetsp:Transcript_2159/g.3259  ORF Transcript_2159/g.3259 Transcript_2159/m.3259 type:complete len:142 (+) Transcript_2159:189-614(+)
MLSCHFRILALVLNLVFTHPALAITIFALLLGIISVLLTASARQYTHQLDVISLEIKCIGKSIEDIENAFHSFFRFFVHCDLLQLEKGFTFTGWTRISDETLLTELVKCVYHSSNDYKIKSYSIEISADRNLKCINLNGGH